MWCGDVSQGIGWLLHLRHRCNRPKHRRNPSPPALLNHSRHQFSCQCVVPYSPAEFVNTSKRNPDVRQVHVRGEEAEPRLNRNRCVAKITKDTCHMIAPYQRSQSEGSFAWGLVKHPEGVEV